MAELTMTTFISLDGVMQAPGGPTEDPSDGFLHGGWTFPYADEEMGATMLEIFSKASAFLLGRRTYDIFASWWPKVTNPDDIVATKLNSLPKFVASRTQSFFPWKGSSLLQNVESGARNLKKQYTGEVQVHGSCGLAQTLIAADLIDEYRILTFPVLLGSGRRLFGSGTIPMALKLVNSHSTSKGIVISVYRRAGSLKTGSF